MELYKYEPELIGDTHIAPYVLSNDNGIRVKLLSYGCTIAEIQVPDQRSHSVNIVLGLKHMKDYIDNPLYCGATLGPNAGRIADSVLSINNSIRNLSNNDGIHNLHGGYSNLSHQNWKFVSEGRGKDHISLTLGIVLPDNTDGYPGNRRVTAEISLNNNNILSLKYNAMSDKATYLNLSNHTYFNLSGNYTDTALEQELHIPSKVYIRNREDHIPETFAFVENTPFDFNSPCSLLQNLLNYPDDLQLQYGKGYNHGFALLNTKQFQNNPSAILRDKTSGRSVELFTDAPCCVLYSGGFIGRSHLLTDGSYSSESCAIALEAQDYPNAPNWDQVPYDVLPKSALYERTIQYKISFG